MTPEPLLLPLAYWVHDLDPIILRIHGDIAIRWYGVAYVSGFIAAYLLLFKAWRDGRSPLSPRLVEGLTTWAVVGVLVGGRLGFMLLYDLPAFLHNPLIFFQITKGGMAFHGGAAGVVLALILFSRFNKLDKWRVGDVVAMATPPGLLLGRIANFVNGELWGHPATVPWAVIFPNAPVIEAPGVPLVALDHPLLYEGLANPRHPSQLYEASLEGLLLGAYMILRFWKSNPARTPPGQLGGEFLIGYALLRMLGEHFRVPDASLFLGLSRGTFYSIFMVAAGIGVILWARRRTSSK